MENQLFLLESVSMSTTEIIENIMDKDIKKYNVKYLIFFFFLY